MLQKKYFVFVILFLIFTIFSSLLAHPGGAYAKSFLSNTGVTKVTMRVLPCEKEKDEKGVEKCKKPKNDSLPDKQAIPLVLTKKDSSSYPEENVFEKSLQFIKNLFGI